MERNERYYDVQKARVYRDLYRPSSNISRFLRALWGIMIVGDSPISRHDYISSKRTK